ncbi:MAG: hypothetical protein J6I36_00300 [Bacteroidaceae bacterium]|nr:hypothetical protein [Bacteroidaceae bacterium]MBR1665403.1 hypothetical protein [Bacteroidaceae bacterium]
MKKTYIQPTLSVVTIAQSLPIAVSLGVDNNKQNGIVGDVKGNDDWDIWGDDAVLDEE